MSTIFCICYGFGSFDVWIWALPYLLSMAWSWRILESEANLENWKAYDETYSNPLPDELENTEEDNCRD
jgi:hypothetical protein